MKAYRLQEFGGPDGPGSSRSFPTPSPGRDRCAIRVRAVSLNYRDLLIAKGVYNPKLKLPLIPVSDGSRRGGGPGRGRDPVHASAIGSSRLHARLAGRDRPTMRKAARPWAAVATACWPSRPCCPSTASCRSRLISASTEAATLPCAAVTAWNALVESGGIRPGDTVLMQGTGGVSLFALQFARLAGARVIATSSSDEKLAKVRELGASEGINYKTTPDWDKRARELTGGQGVDLIVEVGGAGTLPRSTRAIKLGGQIALIGVLTGAGEVNPMLDPDEEHPAPGHLRRIGAGCSSR